MFFVFNAFIFFAHLFSSWIQIYKKQFNKSIPSCIPKKKVSLRINLKKGQKAYYSKPDDKNAVTPLSKILVKAYILQKRLIENPGLNQAKFCKLNKISPRYFRAIMQFNFLSPKLKKRIMEAG